MRKFNRSSKVMLGSKNKGKVRSRKVEIDGIKFQSRLEGYMYECLKDLVIPFEYEKHKYTLFEGFHFPNISFERQANGKGDMINRGEKRILPITYKPDFVGKNFIIECKGHANESFPLRWKMFKRLVKDTMPDVTLYKPQKKSECEEVAKLILERGEY